MKIPDTDDALLLRTPMEEERLNLIDKYSDALSILKTAEDAFPVLDSLTPKGHMEIEAYCRKEYLFWLQMEGVDYEDFEEKENEYAYQDLPF